MPAADCYPRVSAHPEVQARYESMREGGESHRFAELIATRGFPGVRTDATFNAGRCNGNQFERTPGLGDHYRRLAERAGVSTTGKYYQHGLAEYPGDPEAWVSDRHDVLRVAREKGLQVHGAVEHTPPERATPGVVDIAPDLVARDVEAVLASEGGRREDVEERVRAVRTGAIDLQAGEGGID